VAVPTLPASKLLKGRLWNSQAVVRPNLTAPKMCCCDRSMRCRQHPHHLSSRRIKPFAMWSASGPGPAPEHALPQPAQTDFSELYNRRGCDRDVHQAGHRIHHFGTNDAVTFYSFARSLSEHGLEWTYRHGIVWLSSPSVFNHPPLTAYFLRGIYWLSRSEWFRSNGLTFPFLLRLPGIVADFAVVVLLLRIAKTHAPLRRHPWAVALFALSPGLRSWSQAFMGTRTR